MNTASQGADQEIEKLIQLSTIRDIEIKLKEAELDGTVIPEIVYEIIKEVEGDYKKKISCENMTEDEYMENERDREERDSRANEEHHLEDLAER